MEDKYIFTQGKRLRCGYTTGTCAQAAAGAAAVGFFTGEIPPVVRVTTPDGTKLALSVEEATCGRDEKTGQPFAVCAVRKDAGDDIDVTDGMLVFAKVSVWKKTDSTAEIVLDTEEKNTEEGRKKAEGSWKSEEKSREKVGEGRKNEEESWEKTEGSRKNKEKSRDKAEEGQKNEEESWKKADQSQGKTEVADLIRIRGGIGVGRVTKPGLDQPVGEAAINSTPRRMIRAEVAAVMEELGEEVPLDVEIFLPEGEERAKKTMNERLGILGGLSILGTTGIVEPQSHRALIETIRAELSMRHAAGERELLITPGNYGTKFIENMPEFFWADRSRENDDRAQAAEKKNADCAAESGNRTGDGDTDFAERAAESRNPSGVGDTNPADHAVKCSNFIGDTLDAAMEFGFTKVTLVGHIGKLVKLAGGMMNTHSMYGDCRMELLAACGLKAGVPQDRLTRILDCVTCDDALRILSESNDLEPVMKLLGDRIMYHLNYRCKGKIGLRVVVFSNIYGVLVDLRNQFV